MFLIDDKSVSHEEFVHTDFKTTTHARIYDEVCCVSLTIIGCPHVSVTNCPSLRGLTIQDCQNAYIEACPELISIELSIKDSLCMIRCRSVLRLVLEETQTCVIEENDKLVLLIAAHATYVNLRDLPSFQDIVAPNMDVFIASKLPQLLEIYHTRVESVEVKDCSNIGYINTPNAKRDEVYTCHQLRHISTPKCNRVVVYSCKNLARIDMELNAISMKDLGIENCPALTPISASTS